MLYPVTSGNHFEDDIDIRNIVVNQVLMTGGNECKMCKARIKMQDKYLQQVNEMFEDFHIIKIPLQIEHVTIL